MPVVLIEHPDVSRYRFSETHPLRPERVTLSIDLMRAWGLVGSPGDSGGEHRALSVAPPTLSEDDLLLIHSAEYVAAVKRAGRGSGAVQPEYGISVGDTPPFPGMHDAAKIAVAGTVCALDMVLAGEATMAHNPAGGLHHAHRNRASGFCVYNDCAVAIERATRRQPGLRVAYIDIDGHHGDGVEEAFVERPDVLTLSIHESGRYLYPGTGSVRDIGVGKGEGYAVNFPLPPWAGPSAYGQLGETLIDRALENFRPDVVVLQAGADSHRNDPLTHLFDSVEGYDGMIQRIIELAQQYCGGRLVITGGGGYDTFSAVPRMWACALARMLDARPPEELPESWLDLAESAAGAAGVGWHPMTSTFAEWAAAPGEDLLRDAENQVTRQLTYILAHHPLFA